MTSRRDRLADTLQQLSAGGTRPFTRRDTDAAGISSNERQLLLSRGLLTSPHRGVLATGAAVATGAAADLNARARAAALTLPAGGAVGRRTAAELLGVDPRTPWERDRVLDIEYLVPRGRVPVRRPGIRCYATDLPDSDVDHRSGLPVTTPDRTAADLLRWLPPFMALAVLDRMTRLDLIDVERVGDVLDRWDGHRNVATARHLLDNVEPRAESYGESWLRLRILDAGFPRPQAQIPITDATGREIYRLDLGWPELKIAVEYDGEEFHDGRAAERHDHERRTDLWKNRGWTVISFRKGHVLGPGTALEFGVGELLGITPVFKRRPR